MSTAVSPNSDYAECDEFIDYQIRIARDRIRWTDLLTASLLAAVLLIGYVLLFTICDHWLVPGGFAPITPRDHAGTRCGVLWCDRVSICDPTLDAQDPSFVCSSYAGRITRRNGRVR